MHSDAILNEFTHQSNAFNVSPIMSSAQTLDSLIEILPASPEQTWLEVACGPGLISRAMAPLVRSVQGVDLTAAMIDVAAREAAQRGISNVTFSVGDATALPFEDSSFDGAVTRFSLHHIPLPARCVHEMARVVKPEGWVVIGDHIATDEAEEAALHQELERLRDPSHWACLTAERLRQMASAAGLQPVRERLIPMALDYEEWLMRGSGGPTWGNLITRELEQRHAGYDTFRLAPSPDGVPTLHLRYWLSLWQKVTI